MKKLFLLLLLLSLLLTVACNDNITNEFTITFNTGEEGSFSDGEKSKVITVTQGETLTFDEEPLYKDDSIIFSKWVTADNKEYTSNMVVDSDLTFIAEWKYLVTFDPGYGKWDDNTSNPITAYCNYGNSLSQDKNLTAEDFTFSHWESSDGKALEDSIITTPMTFHPVWTSVWDGSFATDEIEGMINSSTDKVISITKASQLAGLQKLLERGSTREDEKKYIDYTFILENHMDLSNHPWYPIGRNIIGKSFESTFEGKNRNITFSSFQKTNGAGKGDNQGGLFGYLGVNAIVRDLNIIFDNAETDLEVQGSIAGSNYGKIYNCTSSGYIETTSVTLGGIVSNNYGLIFGSSSSAKLVAAGEDYLDPTIGGIAANNEKSSDSPWGARIYGCYFDGEAITYRIIGGIAAQNKSGEILASYSIGSLELLNQDYSPIAHAGGIVGDATGGGSIIACYSISEITLPKDKNYIGTPVSQIRPYYDDTLEIQLCYSENADGKAQEFSSQTAISWKEACETMKPVVQEINENLFIKVNEGDDAAKRPLVVGFENP